MAKARKGSAPWDDRWPCPARPENHTVLVDIDGRALYHFEMPGTGNLCRGTGEQIKDYE